MRKEYNINNVETCRRCLGEGVVTEIDSRKEIICPVCKGTGMVIVRKDIIITVIPKYPKPYANRS